MWYNFFRENTIRIVYTLLFLIGGALITWSILLMIYTRPDPSFYQTTSGYIRRSDQIAPDQYRVRVEHTLPNGNSVSGEAVLSADSPPLMGEEVLIHYNPYTPTELAVKELPPIQYPVLIFFGIMAGGLGFRFFIKTIFRNAKIDFICENGKKISPSKVLIEERVIRLFRFVRIPVLILHCTLVRPWNDDQLEFYSDPYPLNKREKLDLQSVRVFFIPQDPRRYYIHVGTIFDSSA